MRRDERRPRRVPDGVGLLGGADEIREEDRRQHAVGRRDRAHARQELLDLVQDLVRVEERHVVVTRELDEAGARNVRRDVPPLFHPRVQVAGSVEDERRALHAREHVADVRLRVHEDEVARARGAQAGPPAALEPGSLGRGRVRPHRREVDVLAPGGFELRRLAHPFVPRGRPRVVVVGVTALRVRPVEHDRPGPLGVRRGEEDGHRPAFRVAEEGGGLAPPASMTARTSSMRVSKSGKPTPRSERPVPRLSSRMRRANDPRRSWKCAAAGSSQSISRWEKKPWTRTRSNGPSPVTW